MEVKEKTNTLKELHHQLSLKPAIKTYGEVFKTYATNLELPDHLLLNKGDSYRRVRLFGEDEYEVILASFAPGQATPIHNYGHQQGWGFVLSGELSEVKYGINRGLNSITELFRRSVGKNEITYINDYQGMHQFANESDMVAISLHLYVEPISSWNVYNKDKMKFEEVNVTCEEDYSSDYE